MHTPDALKYAVIDQLHEIADLLEAQQANSYRVNAFRRAAETLQHSDLDIRQRVEHDGMAGLTSLPGIGSGIGSVIYEIIATGRSSRLENLRGSLQPEQVFQSIPGVGVELARKIHEQLHVDTLESLEIAAHDGRLEQVEGVGPRRASAIRASLQTMLGHKHRWPVPDANNEVPVAMLLDVDDEYRRKAEARQLPTIAPKRFNPDNKAWLPVLHTSRGIWHFTVLFSNTARAHELDRIHDWVVVYFYDDAHHENQHTVVTENHGSLVGRRVVRGRETECRQFYLAAQRELE